MMRRVRSGTIRCERPMENGTPSRSQTGWMLPSHSRLSRIAIGTRQPAVSEASPVAASRWIQVLKRSRHNGESIESSERCAISTSACAQVTSVLPCSNSESHASVKAVSTMVPESRSSSPLIRERLSSVMPVVNRSRSLVTVSAAGWSGSSSKYSSRMVRRSCCTVAFLAKCTTRSSAHAGARVTTTWT